MTAGARPPIISDVSASWLINQDKAFGTIHDKYGLPPSWSRPEGFESLCLIILEQQVSLQSARSTFEKLVLHIGEVTPERVLSIDDSTMRILTVSRQKARYLKILAKELISGRLDLNVLSSLNQHEAMTILTSLTGIGPWTAQVYLMFCLQKQDFLPLGDVALVNAIRSLKGPMTREDLIEQTLEWSPYRTAASFFLWHYYLCERGRTWPS